MKINKGSATGWVITIIIVALALGLWWWIEYGNSAGYTVPTDATSIATTTAATTTPVIVTSTNDTVNEVIASLGDASEFQSLWSSTGVSAMVTGKGPYTVFVPTDESFVALAPNTLSNMTAAQIKTLIENHVVAGRALNIDAVSSGSMTALSKDMLNFQVNVQSDQVQVDSAWAIQEYKASNGVVYMIGGVLLPPASATQ